MKPKLPFNSPPSHTNWRKHPIAGGCALLTILNWLLFFGMSMYLGGFALGTRPSVDGFVLVNKGRHSPPVSESVWLFCLIYGGLTLALLPPLAMFFISVQCKERWTDDPRLKWAIFCGALLFLIAWESGVGSSLCESIRDWSTSHNRPLRWPGTRFN
jgi:hypothetical protein